jgi:hypothetical protein
MSTIEQSIRFDLLHVLSITACQRHPLPTGVFGFGVDPQENASCWNNHTGAPILACCRSPGPDVRNANAA